MASIALIAAGPAVAQAATAASAPSAVRAVPVVKAVAAVKAVPAVRAVPAVKAVPADKAVPAVAAVPATGLTITDSPTPIVVSRVGQTVAYDFAVVNHTPGTLTGVSVTDTQTAPAGASGAATCLRLRHSHQTCSGTSVDLTRGQGAIFQFVHVVTAADLANLQIQDSATASGTDAGAVVVASTPATSTVLVAALEIEKSASPVGFAGTGTTLTYTFTVHNTGVVDLSAVAVRDHQDEPLNEPISTPVCVALSSPDGSCSGSSISLAAGQTATFTATHVITDADVTIKHVWDTARADGSPAGGEQVTSDPATLHVSAASVQATKVANPAFVTQVGQTITSKIWVKNSGKGTLTVTVADTNQAPAGSFATGPTCVAMKHPKATCSGSSAIVVPGQYAKFVTTYLTTAADLLHRTITDTAVASGTTSTGDVVTSAPVSATVDVGALTVVKSTGATSISRVGQVVSYRFAVTNTGSIPLTNVGVADVQASPASPLTSGPTCPLATLAPLASEQCTATYKVTQADLDHGGVTDTARATAVLPDATTLTSAPSTLTLPVSGSGTEGVSVGPTGGTVGPTGTAGPTGGLGIAGVSTNALASTGSAITGKLTAALAAIALGLLLMFAGRSVPRRHRAGRHLRHASR